MKKALVLAVTLALTINSVSPAFAQQTDVKASAQVLGLVSLIQEGASDASLAPIIADLDLEARKQLIQELLERVQENRIALDREIKEAANEARMVRIESRLMHLSLSAGVATAFTAFIAGVNSVEKVSYSRVPFRAFLVSLGAFGLTTTGAFVVNAAYTEVSAEQAQELDAQLERMAESLDLITRAMPN